MSADTVQVRVIDWGQSGYFLPGKRYSTSVSTLRFMAPELLLDYHFHDYALDIWSTGCMLAEMTFLKFEFFEAEKYSPRPKTNDEMYTIKDKQRNKEQLEAIAQVMGTLKLKQYANKFQDDMDLTILDGFEDYKKPSFTKFINEKNKHLVDPDVIDLLEKMFTYDHTRRITAAEALMHPYFDEVRDTVFSDLSASSSQMNLAQWKDAVAQVSL